MCVKTEPNHSSSVVGVHSDLAHVIVNRACSLFRVSIADLASKSRHRDIVDARRLAVYALRKCTTSSYPEINRLVMGKVGHTTALYLHRDLKKLLSGDQDWTSNDRRSRFMDGMTIMEGFYGSR